MYWFYKEKGECVSIAPGILRWRQKQVRNVVPTWTCPNLQARSKAASPLLLTVIVLQFLSKSTSAYKRNSLQRLFGSRELRCYRSRKCMQDINITETDSSKKICKVIQSHFLCNYRKQNNIIISTVHKRTAQN